MKNNNNNTPFYISFALIIFLSLIVLVDYKSDKNALTESKSQIMKSQNKKSLNPSRSIASVKPHTNKKSKPIDLVVIDSKKVITKREVVGSKGQKYHIVNSVNKDWKKLATKKLEFTWGHKAGRLIEITNIKPAIYVKHGIAKNVEHVRIALTNEKGKRSGYEAYINSETGSIIQTWNRTRYEFNKPLSASGKGKGFKGNTLNYKK